MSLGFIMLRHVVNKKNSELWKLSYNGIRMHYPNNDIIIIDDNSNYDYIDNDYEKMLYKTKIIKSEFSKGKGEILPYYYYLKNKDFDIACIIHDSVIINKNIDMNVYEYKFIWHFDTHDHDQCSDENLILSSLNNNNNLKELHKNKNLWSGCFGSMCIIKYDFLKNIDDKHNISNMIPYINRRYNRMSLERVIAVILQSYNKNKSLLGEIFEYIEFSKTKRHPRIEDINNLQHLPFIKTWNSR